MRPFVTYEANRARLDDMSLMHALPEQQRLEPISSTAYANGCVAQALRRNSPRKPPKETADVTINEGSRKLILQMGISLDGFVAVPSGDGLTPVMEGGSGLAPEDPELTPRWPGCGRRART
jgi:hypothetical protein